MHQNTTNKIVNYIVWDENMLPQKMPFGHEDDFQLEADEDQQMQKEALSKLCLSDYSETSEK